MIELWAKVKNYKWLTGILIIWLLLAFSFLIISIDHPLLSAETATKIYKTINDVVLLKWVTKYQALLAGLAALVGGAFVIIANKTTMNNQRIIDDNRTRSLAKVACSIVADEFRDVDEPFTLTYNYDSKPIDMSNYFKQTDSYLHIIHNINPQLGSIISANKRDIIKYLSNIGIIKEYKNRNLQRARSAACYHILLHVLKNLNSDGSFDMDTMKPIPISSIISHVKQLPCPQTDLIGLYTFFDWAASAAPPPKS